MKQINWGEFQAHQRTVAKVIENTANKKLILFVGNTEAGKSTVIDRLMGVDLVVQGGLRVKLVPNPLQPDQKVYCEIGQSNSSSCTLIPQAVDAGHDDLVYIDTPGQKHAQKDKDDAETIATTVPNLLKSKHIHGIVLVIDVNILSTRGQYLIETLDNIDKIIPLDTLKEHIIYCFNRVPTAQGMAEDLFQSETRKEIREYLANSKFKKTLNDENMILVKSEANPDITMLKNRMVQFSTQKPIDCDLFKLNNIYPNISDEFYDFSVALETEKKDTTPPVATVYQALIDTSKALHQITGGQVHLPNLTRLQGDDIQSSFSAILKHYAEIANNPNKYPSDLVQKLSNHLSALLDSFKKHFSNSTAQITYYENVIASLGNVLNHQKTFTAFPLNPLPDQHKRTVSNDTAITPLRHLQQDVFVQSQHPDYHQIDYTPADDTALLKKLNDTLSGIGSDNLDSMHAFTGWLLKKYQPTASADIINPKLFVQFIHEMIKIEQSPALSQNKSVDPDNVILNRTKDLLKKNEALITSLKNDESFYNDLIKDYHSSLENVSAALNDFISGYEKPVIKSLKDNYPMGKSGVKPFTFHLMDDPDTFCKNFDGLTINSFSEGIVSGEIENKYSDNLDPANRQLALTIDPIYQMLKGNIDKKVLAGEYLGLISFTKANQTANVEHPEIPYERYLPVLEMKEILLSMNPNWVNDGVNGGKATWTLCEGSPEFNIKLNINIKDNDKPIYQPVFKGSYKDIKADGGIWLHNINKYSASGGTGGCYHYQLRNALVPYIHENWEACNGTFTLGKQLHDSPDVNNWFLTHRKAIAKALKEGKIEGSDENQTKLINDYKQKLMKLDIAVSTLQLYSLLIGKSLQSSPLSDLVNSTKINAEIDKNKDTVTQSDLAPSIAEKLKNENRITATQIKEMPITGNDHAQSLYKLAQYLILIHESWRTIQQTLPREKVMSPDTDVNKIQFFTTLMQKPNAQKVKIKYRYFQEVFCAQFSTSLRQMKSLKRLTLRGTNLSTASLQQIMSNVVDVVNSLEKIDISHNPCNDRDKQATMLLHDLSKLILQQKSLKKLNVSSTKMGTPFMQSLALALAKDPPLEKLNMLNISSCSDQAGLELIAALCINTHLTECNIDSRSLNVVISDAIDLIMDHKKHHSKHIPPHAPKRLDYFNSLILQYLQTRTGLINKTAMHAPFESFDLLKTANGLIQLVNSTAVPELISTRMHIDDDASSATKPKTRTK